MSVINTALQDLQQARSNEALKATTEMPPVEQRPKSSTAVLLALVLIVLALALTVLWLMFERPSNAPLLPQAVAEVETESVPAQTTMPVPTENQLTGLQFQQQAREFRLEFRLQSEPVFFLEQQKGQTQSFRLRDVALLIETPIVEANDWLEGIRLQQQDSDVLLTLELQPLVELEAHSIAEQNYRWQLVLRLPPLASQSEAMATPKRRAVLPVEENSAPPIATKNVVAAVKPAPVKPQPKPEKALSAVATPAPVRQEQIVIDHNDRLQQVAQLRQQAQRWLQQGQVERGLAQLRELLKRDDALTSGTILADWYVRLGQTEQALQLLRQLLQRYPEAASVRVSYARMLVTQQRYPQAMEVLSTLEQAHPQALVVLGNLHQRQGHYAEAIEAYQASLQMQPQQPKTLAALGLSLEASGQPVAAKNIYEQIIKQPELGPRLQKLLQQRLEAMP